MNGPPAGTYPLTRLPAITVDQMREVDRVMIDELGIELAQMMENVGRHLAELALVRYRPASCTVLAGPGGNGGGGLVAARHLHNRGVATTVVLSDPDPPGVPGHQLGILRRMDVPIVSEPRPSDLVIDALIGYSLHEDPRGPAARWIRWANAAGAPILALDVPSGLDATTGRSVIRASWPTGPSRWPCPRSACPVRPGWSATCTPPTSRSRHPPIRPWG